MSEWVGSEAGRRQQIHVNCRVVKDGVEGPHAGAGPRTGQARRPKRRREAPASGVACACTVACEPERRGLAIRPRGATDLNR